MNQRASVLVVDDEAGIRKMLSNILEAQGHLVQAVENGKQAIRASKERFFNVALIDIQLPDIEGTKLLDRLKETEPRMVKIIITGYPSLQNAVQAVNKGADAYVFKPFDPRELLRIVEKHLKKQRVNAKYSDQKLAVYIETQAKKIKLDRANSRVH